MDNNRLSILDCTLRDGGYVNDWNFGHSVLTGTYKRLDAAGVDYIEVGFLDDRRSFDFNRSIMPNTEAINKIYGKIKKQHAISVAMIDYGTCSIDNIGDCDTTFIDGIRVIFKKEKIDEALPFCKQIKEKGYKLFIQAISITAYSEQEMLDYVKRINEIKPYAFSIVDTYGLLDKDSLSHYFHIIDDNLDPDICLGYHAHNNFQLGFSNSILFLQMPTKRHLVADSTAYGMGKSAGNCATELLAMHMNDYYKKQYNLDHILEIIDTDLMAIWQKQFWGYRYEFYISAMQKCHPNYVKFLLDKKTLSVSAINDILSSIPAHRKLHYDANWINDEYLKYQSHKIDDSANISNLTQELDNRDIVLLGPGNSINECKEQIISYIENNNSIVICTNVYTDEFPIDYVFMSNAKRYSKLMDVLNGERINAKLLLTSNIDVLTDYLPDSIFNYEQLYNTNCTNSDNSLIMLLGLLHKAGVRNVHLAGFDGYSSDETTDYMNPTLDFLPNKQVAKNATMSADLALLNQLINIEFITPTKYAI